LVTASLVALNLAVFLVEIGSGDADLLVRRWGLVPADVLGSAPALVTLLTSVFLHAGWLHLLSNVLYLAMFGPGVERLLGWSRYLLLYLASGALGGLVHVAAQPQAALPAVGASGAIAGLIAANLLLRPGVMLGPTALWLGTQLFIGVATVTSTSTGTAWWAHLGGFAAGLGLTQMLRARRVVRQ
jgi:membrane associated rhomboid family serine protease